ncbi:MAG: hypothetical protein SGBAC_007350 [Bacillariaceae sp.]
MTLLTIYFNELLASRGVTDMVLVNDGATVLKTRSYPYLSTNKSQPEKEEDSKFTESSSTSCCNSQAPCCPRRKRSVDDFATCLDRSCETKFQANIDPKGIDKMFADMMMKRREREQNHRAQRINIKDASDPVRTHEFLDTPAQPIDTDELLRDVVSKVANLLNKDDFPSFDQSDESRDQ